jgi:hypothetical protein
MKKTMILVVALLVSIPTFSQPRKYKKSMEKAMEMFHQVSSPEDFMACAETFEGISAQYGEMWLPPYYGAYCLTLASLEAGDYSVKEEYLKRSGTSIEKMLELNPDESEVQALIALNMLALMAMAPETNGPMYLEDFNSAVQKAKELNPENPRPYYMDGLLKANLPEFMGGGVAEARALHQKAAEKYKSFRNDDPFWPGWGEDLNQEQLDSL